MCNLKHFLIGLIRVAFLVGAVGLVVAPPSQADALKGGFQFKKILKKIFPPCGPGTRHQRFNVSKDGNKVCDNKTGLWWEQSPSTSFFTWQQAIDHCANLTLSGKTWRLPTIEEYQWDSLIDYSVPNQAAVLNAGPFSDVLPTGYWSASANAGVSTRAWNVDFNNGIVFTSNKSGGLGAWCVSDGKKKHADW